MNPVLTIIIPSYNMHQYIDKCLSSLIDKRFENRLQVIVINDGSKDDTLEIAKKYEVENPQIFEVVDKPNGGHGSVVNVGIVNAKGKYFRILDADDWVNTENLAKLLEILEHTDSDMVVDEKREVNMESGKTEFYKLPEEFLSKKCYDLSDISNRKDIFPYIMLHTLSIKTEILHKNDIKVQEGVYYDDIEFIIKSTVNASSIEFYDLEIYQYLVGNVNQSVYYKNYVKNYRHHDTVTKELVRFAMESDVPQSKQDYLDIRVSLLINTHLNISLIYNDNRAEGAAWGKEFIKYLKATAPHYYDLVRKRYMIMLVLHYLGVNFDRMNKLKGILR